MGHPNPCTGHNQAIYTMVSFHYMCCVFRNKKETLFFLTTSKKLDYQNVGEIPLTFYLYFAAGTSLDASVFKACIRIRSSTLLYFTLLYFAHRNIQCRNLPLQQNLHLETYIQIFLTNITAKTYTFLVKLSLSLDRKCFGEVWKRYVRSKSHTLPLLFMANVPPKRKSVYVSIPLFVVLESAECLNKITEIQVKTSMYLFYLLLTNYCFNMPFTNRLKVPVPST